MDAVFDTPADVPEDVRTNKRYAAAVDGFTVSETADKVRRDFGKIDVLIHSLANGPEVKKPLLETSRQVKDGTKDLDAERLAPRVHGLHRWAPAVGCLPSGQLVPASHRRATWPPCRPRPTRSCRCCSGSAP